MPIANAADSRPRILLLFTVFFGMLATIASWAQSSPSTPPAKSTASARLPSAREVFATHVKALGGEQAIHRHTSIHVKGTWEIPGLGRSGPLEIFAAEPNKFLMRADVPGFRSEAGFNGQVGWGSNEAMGPDPVIMKGKGLERMRAEADFYGQFNRERRYRSMRTVERTRFEGQECYKLKLVAKTGDELFEFYDVKSGLFAGAMKAAEGSQGKVWVTIVEEDYKKFGDLLLAARTLRKMAVEEVLTYTSVEFDNVPDSVFEPPPKVKEQLKK